MAKSEKQRLKRKHKQRQKATREEWKMIRCRDCGRIFLKSKETGIARENARILDTR